MKLYMVTDGDYSDYRVEGIYSTREKAEYAKRLFHALNDIEEIELDDIPDHPRGMLYYVVIMDKEGNTEEVSVRDCRDQWEEEWRPYDDNKHVAFCMWAKDAQHAVKIANERRIRLIESGEWNTSWNTWRKARI